MCSVADFILLIVQLQLAAAYAYWCRPSAVFCIVFSLVRRAVVVRCPDHLLLFLFHFRRRPGPPLALLFHFSYTAALAAVSSSASFAAQHSFPVQPASICPQLHFPSNKNANLVVRLLTRADHLISFPRVLFRTHQILQKWVIKLSCQISNSPVFKSLLQVKKKIV